MQEYIAMWQNYFNFSDRTSVRGYWMVVLINIIVGMILGVIISAVPHLSFISGLYTLVTIIPGLALNVRRLRDAGKHWSCLFLCFIPLVGAIIVLVFLCRPTSNFEGQQV